MRLDKASFLWYKQFYENNDEWRTDGAVVFDGRIEKQREDEGEARNAPLPVK